MLELFAASVTVRITEFAPILPELKVVLFSDKTKLPATVQLSDEPLSISWGVIVAFPVPSRVTEIFWQTAVGAVVSSAVPTVTCFALEHP